MTFFELNDPLSPAQSKTIGMQDLNSLCRAHLRQIVSSLFDCFSELDQAFVAWGIVTLAIFSIAQLSSLSWTTQAVIDAALTGLGIAGTSKLTWQIATIAKLRWVIVLWASLMMGGMIVTAYGIFGGVALILANLCPLWVGLCALCYGIMAVGMRSRCFGACAVVHALAIAELYRYPSWQFLISGLVIALTLFFFFVVPWDMRSAADDDSCQ